MSIVLDGMVAVMGPHIFKRVSDIVKERHPHAFYTAEEVKSIHTPPFPLQKRRRTGSLLGLLPGRRKLSGLAP